NDKIDRALFQRFPKLFAVFAFANRRTALELSCSIGDVFGGEVQIVGTSLSGNWQSRFLGLAEHRQCLGGGMMHDVHATAGLAAEANHQLHSFVFGFTWTRSEKCSIRSR